MQWDAVTVKMPIVKVYKREKSLVTNRLPVTHVLLFANKTYVVYHNSMATRQ